MKQILILAITTLITLGVFAQVQQIPNNSFESWADEYNAEGWNSINIPFVMHSATKSSNSNEGAYAAKLETKTYLGNAIPGVIMLGEINIQDQSMSGGIEYSDRPTGISADLKYEHLETDTMVMFALLTKWNEAEGKTDTIGATGYFSGEQMNEYITVSMPFVYISDETPDTLNVGFLSSAFNGKNGSILYVDNVVMQDGPIISPTICLPAIDTTEVSFIANWMSVPTATGYFLDVAYEPTFETFLEGYENKFVETSSELMTSHEIVSNISSLFYYRVRVQYDGDVVGMNSNKISVPMQTVCNEAQDITSSSFKLSWEESINATSYVIDVAIDEQFQNTIINSADVGSVFTYDVSNLDANTNYFCRVKSIYGEIVSDYSNTLETKTLEHVGVNNLLVNDINIKVISNTLYITSNTKRAAEIYDIKGRLIYNYNINKGENIINLYKAGIYFIKIISDKKTYTEKIIIN